MTVKELIEALDKGRPDDQVMLSVDDDTHDGSGVYELAFVVAEDGYCDERVPAPDLEDD